MPGWCEETRGITMTGRDNVCHRIASNGTRAPRACRTYAGLATRRATAVEATNALCPVNGLPVRSLLGVPFVRALPPAEHQTPWMVPLQHLPPARRSDDPGGG